MKWYWFQTYILWPSTLVFYAFMYLMLGGGEHRTLTRGHNPKFKMARAKTDFNIFE